MQLNMFFVAWLAESSNDELMCLQKKKNAKISETYKHELLTNEEIIPGLRSMVWFFL